MTLPAATFVRMGSERVPVLRSAPLFDCLVSYLIYILLLSFSVKGEPLTLLYIIHWLCRQKLPLKSYDFTIWPFSPVIIEGRTRVSTREEHVLLEFELDTQLFGFLQCFLPLPLGKFYHRPQNVSLT